MASHRPWDPAFNLSSKKFATKQRSIWFFCSINKTPTNQISIRKSTFSICDRRLKFILIILKFRFFAISSVEYHGFAATIEIYGFAATIERIESSSIVVGCLERDFFSMSSRNHRVWNLRNIFYRFKSPIYICIHLSIFILFSFLFP